MQPSPRQKTYSYKFNTLPGWPASCIPQCEAGRAKRPKVILFGHVQRSPGIMVLAGPKKSQNLEERRGLVFGQGLILEGRGEGRPSSPIQGRPSSLRKSPPWTGLSPWMSSRAFSRCGGGKIGIGVLAAASTGQQNKIAPDPSCSAFEWRRHNGDNSRREKGLSEPCAACSTSPGSTKTLPEQRTRQEAGGRHRLPRSQSSLNLSAASSPAAQLPTERIPW